VRALRGSVCQGGGVARETFQHREGVPSMFEKEDKAPFLDAPGGGASWRDRPGHVDNISEGAVPHNASSQTPASELLLLRPRFHVRIIDESVFECPPITPAAALRFASQ